MTIEIVITEVEKDIEWQYREADSNKLVGRVREGRNKPGCFMWHIPENGDGGFQNLKEAHYVLQNVLTQYAVNLGCEIKFINNIIENV